MRLPIVCHTRRAAALAAIAVSLTGGLVITPAAAKSKPAVTALVFSPQPIGVSGNATASEQISVVLSALNSSDKAVPGVTVYVSFHQATGGGTAVANDAILSAKPTGFITNSNGQINITYTTPSTFPTTGVDVLRAQNGKTVAESTLTKVDPFCFSSVTVLGFTPKPLASKGSLSGHKSVPVTLTALGSGGSPVADTTVWVAFHAASSGATATIGSTMLTATLQPFTTDANGQVHIVYTTAQTPPTTGLDSLVGSNEAQALCLTSRDSYVY